MRVPAGRPFPVCGLVLDHDSSNAFQKAIEGFSPKELGVY